MMEYRTIQPKSIIKWLENLEYQYYFKYFNPESTWIEY
jgi:hypothetical protein